MYMKNKLIHSEYYNPHGSFVPIRVGAGVVGSIVGLGVGLIVGIVGFSVCSVGSVVGLAAPVAEVDMYDMIQLLLFDNDLYLLRLYLL